MASSRSPRCTGSATTSSSSRTSPRTWDLTPRPSRWCSATATSASAPTACILVRPATDARRRLHDALLQRRRHAWPRCAATASAASRSTSSTTALVPGRPSSRSRRSAACKPVDVHARRRRHDGRRPPSTWASRSSRPRTSRRTFTGHAGLRVPGRDGARHVPGHGRLDGQPARGHLGRRRRRRRRSRRSARSSRRTTTFPNRTNVEFAQLVDDEHHPPARVGARGGGDARLRHRRLRDARRRRAELPDGPRRATIELPGGELLVRWHENDHVYMTGPATEVFTGASLCRGRRRGATTCTGRPARADRSATMFRNDPPPIPLRRGCRTVRTAERIANLPPYLFAEIDRKKAREGQAQGVDVISLGIGDPDTPTPEHIVDAMAEADHATRRTTSTRATSALQARTARPAPSG